MSRRQRWRARLRRKGSPHAIAGRRLAATLLGRRPSRGEARGGQVLFQTLYGVGWGLVHAGARRGLPFTRRGAGLPFAVPFYLACDALVAPRLGLTPPPTRLPWQSNARELANHVAWTATAEATHRLADRFAR